MRAFIFPGQGSQTVGMGKALADASVAARHVFEEVDEALKQNLFRLMTEGPEEGLRLTENAQPAIMANALAVLAVLEKEGGIRLTDKADFVAGHSLGEYSALAAADAFDITTTARLLKQRGQAMQAAVPVGEGTMAAILGLDLEAVEAIAADAAQGDVCQAANDNAPGQVVISGSVAAIERAVSLAKERGARRAVMLDVSAPFHCSLMQPAAEVMAKALKAMPPRQPVIPVFANVSATAESDPKKITELLIEQITGRVRWRESIAAMAEAGVDEFVEFGGKVLSPMIRRIAPDSKAISLVTPADIENFAAHL
ncbi:ACP S-malonyltransferase [Zymomonas mobilis]|uniref:Malonyl CoA-acyl carrier protein transacylase n=1 Tax=Zymomonas mobilis subsp. pomaceae (strain ATCC 29192 / DSM 22645 / JCM 10191 / CCUG 17912 / NBRC 13757 / NCIMB 11200 / NRRL B-4491 / Barker I) TaxID=579138 RepID=F8ET98_ZYMMT|nr:ACP S-malonyltransferase [Zymomonas mobilis]AEI36988.1 malonyl CoA-acyl carrier protein transacylase [Zymomonas mobilis subsp. pomaceae ATCC 29192]MDX5948361.1 ACP S-malonyltransferase [Zymomonas mobilis subsp. pomaceae]GEB89651.1 malonyl CoA-acyl carrier protein transacylase [Zymomonas mobilis subsp. pomaceae]